MPSVLQPTVQVAPRGAAQCYTRSREGRADEDKLLQLCKAGGLEVRDRVIITNMFMGEQGRVGEDKLVQLCKDGGLAAGKLLAADPEFDPADLPEPAAFLKSKGLGAIPL